MDALSRRPMNRVGRPKGRKPRLYYLHIGKTGGSGMRDMIELSHDVESCPVRLVYLNHRITLETQMEAKPDSRVFYFVRDPVERFISGFNSRYRHGYPRYDKSYNDGEKIAFQLFHTPDQLGVALANMDEAARAAWRSILHVKLNHARYLKDVETLDRFDEQIAFVGQTETYDDDVRAFRTLFDIPDEVTPPTDEVRMFRSPAGQPTELSKKARKAVVRRLAKDYAVYEWSLRKRDRILAKLNRAEV